MGQLSAGGRGWFWGVKKGPFSGVQNPPFWLGAIWEKPQFLTNCPILRDAQFGRIWALRGITHPTRKGPPRPFGPKLIVLPAAIVKDVDCKIDSSCFYKLN